MISSGVSVQLVPSIWQTFRDGMTRVAANILAMMSWLSSTRVNQDIIAIASSCAVVATAHISS